MGVLDDVPKWRKGWGKKVVGSDGRKRGKAVSPRSRYWRNLDYAGPDYTMVWGVSVKERHELRVGRKVSNARWRRLWASFCGYHSYLEEYIGFPLDRESGRRIRLALYHRWPGIERRFVETLQKSLAVEDAMRDRVFRNLRWRCVDLGWTTVRLEVEMWRAGWTVTYAYLEMWAQFDEFRSANNWAIVTMLAQLVEVDVWDFVVNDWERDRGEVREWPLDSETEPFPDGMGETYLALQKMMLDHRRSADLVAAMSKLRTDRRGIWGRVERRYDKEARDSETQLLGLKQEIDRLSAEYERGQGVNIHAALKRMRDAMAPTDADGKVRYVKAKKVDDWVMSNIYRSKADTDRAGEAG